MITVIDYGMGNLHSVAKALERVGGEVRVSADPRDIQRAEKLVLPGVGAFHRAMEELERRGLAEPIRQRVTAGVPYLGICLGLQLLFPTSEEGGPARGLGLLPGRVPRFHLNGAAPSLKVPHMGWNTIHRTPAPAQGDGCPLLSGIPDGTYFYFVHSYYADPAKAALVAATTMYGHAFASVVWQDRLFAVQFHPEKSQAAGLRLLRNFVAL